jgi:hypothetical protein
MRYLHRVYAIVLALGSPLAASAAVPSAQPRVDLDAARALVARVVPGHASDFVLAAIPDSNGLDVFEVDHAARGIVLRGSSGVGIDGHLVGYRATVAGFVDRQPRSPRTPHSRA